MDLTPPAPLPSEGRGERATVLNPLRWPFAPISRWLYNDRRKLCEEDDMSTRQTKGQVEAQIAAMITSFEREQMGRGPKEVRVWIVEDLILIRLKGVLTPAEERLAGDPNGRHLLKQLRNRLIETSRAVVEEAIETITGVAMISLHSDLSIRTGERILVLTLAENLEARFRE